LVPYFERLIVRLSMPEASSVPRMMC